MPVLSRRGFLASCAAAGAAGAMTSLPAATWADLAFASTDRPLAADTGILVLITMYGGNDGLNTVIPYTDNAYYDARPDLAYDADDVLQLDDRYGLNPGMPGLHRMFGNGKLAVIRGVGYSKPDRSHFRSMDIWQSASLDNEVATGWIGRWLDAAAADPLDALHLGPVLPTLVAGERCSAAAFSGKPMPSTASDELIRALATSDLTDTLAMTMVRDSYRATARTNRGLAPLYAEDGAPRVGVEDKGLASRLDVVAECIELGVPTRVYSVSIGGFDTHADERGTQRELLQSLDTAVTRFVKRVSGTKHGNDVVVMAYSEFGRRVAANASDGTDHGTAGPVFVLGDRVRGGFYGDDPSLTDLADDDLKVTTDFRDVYHEVLLRGLHTDPEAVLGAGRKPIGFLSA